VLRGFRTKLLLLAVLAGLLFVAYVQARAAFMRWIAPPHVASTAGPDAGIPRRVLGAGVEGVRLAARWAYHDERAAGRRPGARRARQARFPAVASPTMRFTLGPKRIRAAKGDADVPPHQPYRGLPDFRKYRLAFSDDPPEWTSVGFISTPENVADRPIKAVMGKLALRDEAGRALYVTEWHHPQSDEGRLLPPGPAHAEAIVDLRRRDGGPNFRTILFAPERSLRLEWTPTFVCWADGTMEGDVRAYRYIDGEGLPVSETLNGLRWIVKLQYPDKVPDVRLE
jgi:hypothetical protein